MFRSLLGEAWLGCPQQGMVRGPKSPSLLQSLLPMEHLSHT